MQPPKPVASAETAQSFRPIGFARSFDAFWPAGADVIRRGPAYGRPRAWRTRPNDEGTLGLKVVNVQGCVYRSQFAGTNQATVANWLAGGDIETIAQAPDDRGIRFGALRCAGTDPPATPARHGHVQDLLVPRSGRQHISLMNV
jgi:hypothetical protein